MLWGTVLTLQAPPQEPPQGGRGMWVALAAAEKVRPGPRPRLPWAQMGGPSCRPTLGPCCGPLSPYLREELCQPNVPGLTRDTTTAEGSWAQGCSVPASQDQSSLCGLPFLF